jgi:hypothetical protein
MTTLGPDATPRLSAVPPSGTGEPQAGTDAGAKAGRRTGLRMWAVVLLVLVVFAAAYSVGVATKSALLTEEPNQPRRPVPVAVEPAALPTQKVLLPGIHKAGEVSLRTDMPQSYVIGRAGLEGGSAFDNLGLPFAVRELGPQGWRTVILEESAYAIYRGVQAGEPPNVVLGTWIAAHPCRDLASCLADRPEFDNRWTKRFKAAKPTTGRDAQTWYTETKASNPLSYTVSMTRIFRSPKTDTWWLVGVNTSTRRGDMTGFVQATVNDIRTQTS